MTKYGELQEGNKKIERENETLRSSIQTIEYKYNEAMKANDGYKKELEMFSQ